MSNQSVKEIERLEYQEEHREFEEFLDGKPELNFKNVTDIVIEGIDHKDYPDFCDAFIASAVWKHSGEELTEKELDQLQNDFPDTFYEMVAEEACNCRPDYDDYND